MTALDNDVAEDPQRSSVGYRLARALASAAIGILGIATCYEALIAFNVLKIGHLPGQAPSGNGVAVGAALLTLFVGGLLLLASSLRVHPTQPVPTRLLPVVCLAAVGFVVARLLSYDPYYAPTLRRMSDGGISWYWTVFVILMAAAAAGSALRSPRAGMALTAVVMWLSAITAVAAGLH
jgi:hypothetical protein